MKCPGSKESPDGILFNCVINQNRLDGNADGAGDNPHGPAYFGFAQPHAGNEDAPLYVMEYNAWSMTVAVAAYSGEKYFVLPGGNVLWNSKWPTGERNASLDSAIKSFLSDEAALSK